MEMSTDSFWKYIYLAFSFSPSCRQYEA